MKYGGIKLAEIPVILRGPFDQATQQTPQVELKYGFAFSGEYLAAFLVRELTSQVLIYLQGIADPNTIDFLRICEVVAELHRRLHGQIKRSFSRGEAVEFFFGGYCPATGRVRVAKFSIESSSGLPQYGEILTRPVGESFDTIGATRAQQRFRELIKLNLDAEQCRVHFAMFRRLRDVILDPDIRSVGGAIQCGEFAPGSANFALRGAGMVVMGPHHPVFEHFLGGMKLDELPTPGPLGLHVHPTIALPFRADIRNFQPQRTFRNQNGNATLLDELITIVPHDVRWPVIFREEAKKLRRLFGRKVPIEHIGSTSVPDLPAVPTIDILLGQAPIAAGGSEAKHLAVLGYEDLGSTTGEIRPMFRNRSHGNVNLYFAPIHSPFWNEALALRRLLRTDEPSRRRYTVHKIRILNSEIWTLLRYNQLKAPLVQELIGQSPEIIPEGGRGLWKRLWG